MQSTWKLTAGRPGLVVAMAGACMAAGLGCTTASMTKSPAMTKMTSGELTASPGTYVEKEHDGRIYVLGTPETIASFKETGHLPYTQTMIGAGPQGQTVVLEIDKKDPALQALLWDEFKKRNLYYAEEAAHDRLYVLGSPVTHQSFKETKHLPYTRTLIGAGPQGQTVVLEVDKKNDHFAQRLWSEFADRHLYYGEEEAHGRLYVLGSRESHEDFKQTRHLPYTRTVIGAGPGGMTVVYEIDKKNPHLASRLEREFAARH